MSALVDVEALAGTGGRGSARMRRRARAGELCALDEVGVPVPGLAHRGLTAELAALDLVGTGGAHAGADLQQGGDLRRRLSGRLAGLLDDSADDTDEIEGADDELDDLDDLDDLGDDDEDTARGRDAAPAGSATLGAVLLLATLPDEPDPAWKDRALCAETDPEAFFPEKGGSTREAKRVCTSCEVRGDCLDFALTNDERFGIWGGLSERERRRLKKQVG